MATKRSYRKLTTEQKLEIVIAGLKSGNVQEVCRAHTISPEKVCGQVAASRTREQLGAPRAHVGPMCDPAAFVRDDDRVSGAWPAASVVVPTGFEPVPPP